jgi:hypothetical protein
MEKIVKVIGIVVVVALLLATSYLQRLSTSAGAKTFVVTGTDSLYSEIFNSYPTMTLKWFAWDATGSDSTQARVVLQSLGLRFGTTQKWDSEDSTTVSGDSLGGKWQITDEAVSCTRSYRLLVFGLTGNSKIGGSNILFDLWGND